MNCVISCIAVPAADDAVDQIDQVLDSVGPDTEHNNIRDVTMRGRLVSIILSFCFSVVNLARKSLCRQSYPSWYIHRASG